jgi:tetratricopeptide (TPR) repeat protein
MQLTHESYRVRWIVLVTAWTLTAFVLFWHAAAVRDYLALANGLGLRGAAVPNTPLQQPYPAFAADAQTWVRHALSLIEGPDFQLRSTKMDNAPFGREVHWNSAWAWAIAAAGQIYHLFTGVPLSNAVERATVWLTPFTFLVLIIILSSWLTRRAGVLAGLFLVIAMGCHDRVLEGFFPSYVDHHGLLTVSVLGTVLGAMLMGAGWWKETALGAATVLPRSPETVRTAAVFSAICGAAGMWVSAASVIPAIAIIGISGLGAVLVQGRAAQQQGARFDPGAWRIWGRVGAAASLFFYLLEYFPRHLGLRLEVNHPIYALAWIGGGEWIALCGDLWLRSKEERWRSFSRRGALWATLAIAVAPLTIVVGGAKVLSFLDPFMARLHNDYIQEFLPLWRTLRGFTPKMVFQVLVVDTSPLLAAIATLTYWRRESPIVLWFGTFTTGALTAMAWTQSRWQLNASAGQICLALLVVTCWTTSYRPRVRWIVAAIVMGILFLPNGIIRVVGTRDDVSRRVIAPRDASLMLARDVASALRASQPQGEVVMLASPNASTMIGYYGRFQTLGTLYWENAAGLKGAAEIFAAKDENEAARLIRARRVTHIAIISEENFIQQYYQLMHPEQTGVALEGGIRSCFGFRLFYQKVVPQWLQTIPYAIPPDLKSLNLTVMLFKVNFEQTLPEAIYNVALTQIAQDLLNEADGTLDTLIKLAPQFYQPWFRKGEILLSRHDWANATEHFLKGISLAPEAERPLLYENVAGLFYNQQQHSIAAQIYRQGLAERRVPNLACYLAWVLATSTDDSLRNGKEALELAQEALKADPNSPSYLNASAAALAELGRFREAVEQCDRALANAKIRGETNVVSVFEQRLAILKSGKPLRN